MRFYEEKGLAMCGLACVLCSEEQCPGCKNRGCKEADSCSVWQCVTGKGLEGCYQCESFPCGENILQGVRNRAFNRYAREFGREALLERLRANLENGIVYHRPGGLKGDYDTPETEEEIMELIQFGKANPYRDCPAYKTEHFSVRLIREEDADDLFACYGDTEAQRFFNADNCAPFEYTRESIREMVRGWLRRDYAGGWYIRFAIIDQQTGRAIGTLEAYDWKYQQMDRTTGILRIDIASAWEKAELLGELIRVGNTIFFDVFHSTAVITKAIPSAIERIAALEHNVYRKAEMAGKEDYFIRSRM